MPLSHVGTLAQGTVYQEFLNTDPETVYLTVAVGAVQVGDMITVQAHGCISDFAIRWTGSADAVRGGTGLATLLAPDGNGLIYALYFRQSDSGDLEFYHPISINDQVYRGAYTIQHWRGFDNDTGGSGYFQQVGGVTDLSAAWSSASIDRVTDQAEQLLLSSLVVTNEINGTPPDGGDAVVTPDGGQGWTYEGALTLAAIPGSDPYSTKVVHAWQLVTSVGTYQNSGGLDADFNWGLDYIGLRKVANWGLGDEDIPGDEESTDGLDHDLNAFATGLWVARPSGADVLLNPWRLNASLAWAASSDVTLAGASSPSIIRLGTGALSLAYVLSGQVKTSLYDPARGNLFVQTVATGELAVHLLDSFGRLVVALWDGQWKVAVGTLNADGQTWTFNGGGAAVSMGLSAQKKRGSLVELQPGVYSFAYVNSGGSVSLVLCESLGNSGVGTWA